MFSFKSNCKMYATIQVFYVRVWWQEIQTLGLKAFTSEIRYPPWLGRSSSPEQKVWGHRTQQRSGWTLLILDGVSTDLPFRVFQMQPHLNRWLKSKTFTAKGHPTQQKTALIQPAHSMFKFPRPHRKRLDLMEN